MDIPQLISILEEAKLNLPDDEYRPQRLSKIEDMIKAVTSDAFKQESPPKDIYQKALNYYLDWYYQKIGGGKVRFLMTGAHGKALKGILKYFKTQFPEQDEEYALKLFQQLLYKFDDWEKWYQVNAFTPTMIHSKINEIVTHLKNGKANKAASINEQLLRKFNQ